PCPTRRISSYARCNPCCRCSCLRLRPCPCASRALLSCGPANRCKGRARNSELAHALDLGHAAVDQGHRGGERIDRRRIVGVGPDLARIPQQQVGLAGGADELAFAHAAADRDVPAEIESLRRPRRDGRALRGEARLDLLAARKTLLQALALAERGVALRALGHRRTRLGLDVDLGRLHPGRRGFVRIMHRSLFVDPAIDVGVRRNGGKQEETGQGGPHAVHSSYSASSIHAIWIASRIFSPQRFGSSSNPGSAITHWYRSVKRTCSGSASGCASVRAMAMSWVSVHFISCPRPRARS